MNNVEALLGAAGTTTANLVKLTYLLTGAADAPVLGQIRRRRWSMGEPPSVTAFVVLALARPDSPVVIKAIAAADEHASAWLPFP